MGKLPAVPGFVIKLSGVLCQLMRDKDGPHPGGMVRQQYTYDAEAVRDFAGRQLEKQYFLRSL